MVSGVSEKRGPVDARFFRRMPRTNLTESEKIRRDSSGLYLSQSVYERKYARCRSAEDFKALLKEALVYLTSETDAFGSRSLSMPPGRIHIFLRGSKFEECVPQELADLARRAMDDNHLFYMIDTSFGASAIDPETHAEQRVVYVIKGDFRPQRVPQGLIFKDFFVEKGFPEALGISRDRIPVRVTAPNGELQECPAFLILPLVNLFREKVGVAVVVGERAGFLLPQGDLEALRLLGIKTSNYFDMNWPAK